MPLILLRSKGCAYPMRRKREKVRILIAKPVSYAAPLTGRVPFAVIFSVCVPPHGSSCWPPFSFLFMRVFPSREGGGKKKKVGSRVLPFSFKGSFRFFSTPSKEPSKEKGSTQPLKKASSKETKRGAASVSSKTNSLYPVSRIPYPFYAKEGYH